MKKILILTVFLAALFAVQEQESPQAATQAPVAARSKDSAVAREWACRGKAVAEFGGLCRRAGTVVIGPHPV